jgi:hypothetical protein
MKKNIEQSVLSYLLALAALLVWTGLATQAIAYESKISDAKMVRVEVVPAQLQAGHEVTFKVSMNTHSVPLTYDLTRISILKDDAGKEYRPVQWNGSAPGGHHRSGTLEFPALAKGVKSVTLSIKGIANVPDRAFEWKIE